MNRERVKERIKLMQAWLDGEQIQHFHCGNWVDVEEPFWDPGRKYRTKPKPLERWCVFNEGNCLIATGSKENAECYAGGKAGLRIVLMREVMEDE